MAAAPAIMIKSIHIVSLCIVSSIFLLLSVGVKVRPVRNGSF
jgi:hypothetical protein